MFDLAQPWWLLALLGVPLLIAIRAYAPLREDGFKRVAGTALRCLAFTALVIAIAGPLKGSFSDQTDVIFALDTSTSVDRQAAADALVFINQAFAAKDPEAQMGLVVFGGDAAAEVLLSRNVHPVEEISLDVRRDATDIEQALEVAIGGFDAEGERRIVLLSDGRENQGHARSAAAIARSIGVEIVAIPLEKSNTNDEILIERLNAPAWVRVQEPFKLEVRLRSARATAANLTVLRNGTPIGHLDVNLERGANVFSFVEEAFDSGLYEYEAVINGEADEVPENNRYQTFVQVRGGPKVLHAVGDPDWGQYVSDALRAQGLSVDEVPGNALPVTMHQLSEYDLVILNNVTGFDISLAKMQLLEDYVRDAGGGVISLGGDKSYSAGGYYGTPVENFLPVTMDVKSEVKIPTLAVTIVIDKSGSMSNEGKLAIAKSAAYSAIEVLNPLDRVAVLTFDVEPEWSVPPTEVGNRRAIVEKLRMVDSGGGTDLFVALQEAHRVMREQPARVKHLIVLSDGLTDTETNFDAFAKQIADDGITVSTVAFGSNADVELMEKIATWGRGRFYHTEDPQNIPRIFTSETLVVSRDLLVEEIIHPNIGFPGEMIEGFSTDDFPVLGGYQRIFAKPSAQVLLYAKEDDPLLVTWRYGLGKSAAFTSDLSGRWGRDWVGWPQFGRFVSQMARWTMRRTGTEKLLPSFRWNGSRGEIVVDALDRDDLFINGLAMQASIVDPRGDTSHIDLEQTAPGQYRGEFSVTRTGRYYVNLSGRAGDVQVGPKSFGLAVPYSSEYIDLSVDHPHLESIAVATGGQVLPLSNPSIEVITATRPREASHHERIWWPWFLTALVLLLLEIAVRKIALPQTWLGRFSPHSLTEEQAEPAYEALVAKIDEVREQHLRALRYNLRYRPEDPAVRARLYLPGSRNR